MVRKKTFGLLIQDLGMLTFLISIFVSALVLAYSNVDYRMENSVMFLGVILVVVLVSFRLIGLAVSCAGVQVLMFAAFKIYFIYTKGITVEWISYAWLFLPLLSVGSMLLFLQGTLKTELENEVLKNQVEELVLIDPLTGLYNFRSMYNDLERQIAYAHRNSLDLTLMIVKLRYEPELRRILSRTNYDMLKQRLATIAEDSVRLEDKIYAFDDKGSIAFMLTCDTQGALVVKQRLLNRLTEKGAFDKITDATIKVEIKSAYLQYNKEEGKMNAMEFVQKVEGELQYDV